MIFQYQGFNFKIDFENKTVTVKGNEINGIISYDKLVIAVGAKSFVPNIPAVLFGQRVVFL